MDCVHPIQQLLRCQQQSLPIIYLGMPLHFRKPTRNDFTPLIKKLEKRLDGWKARFISRAGRLQLVKSVLSTIPTYYMSVFYFPKWLIVQIDKIRRRFLWSRNDGTRSIYLLNWQTVCLPARCGGMGVLDIRLQNMALLLRWLWRLYELDRRLWATYALMLHTTQRSDQNTILLARSGSFFWMSLLNLKQLFHSCATFRILSGKRVSFWHDPWAGQILADTVMRPIPRTAISLYEARQVSGSMFPAPYTLQQLNAVQFLDHFTPQHGNDYMTWNLSPSGTFSTHSVYKVLSQGGRVRSAAAFLWKARVTPSMRCFLFLLLNDRILTHDVMMARGFQCDPRCTMCIMSQLETAVHLFFQCTYANSIWSVLQHTDGHMNLQVKEIVLLTFLASVPTNRRTRTLWLAWFITTVWMLWKERNQRIFNNKQVPVTVLVDKIRSEVQMCLRYC